MMWSLPGSRHPLQNTTLAENPFSNIVFISHTGGEKSNQEERGDIKS
jgi:hypothetical protein